MRVLKNFPEDEVLHAAIVIPSYDEGDGILPTIEAWVRQTITSGVRAALFVVVNSSRKSNSKVRESNRLTHELVQAFIEGGEDPRRFEEDSWKEFMSLRNMIQATRFRLAVIDLWSKGNSPRKCNVGMARDLGAREACKHLADDGFLVMSDADTLPQRRYLHHANLMLKVLPKMAALTGDVILEDRRDRGEDERILLRDCMNELQVLMQRAARIYYLQKPDRKPFPYLPGSNMVVTKEAYLSVGGIPHINGAEDTELSRKILRAGHAIRDMADFLEVRTSSRVSLRTDPGHGMGQGIKEASDHQQAPWLAPVLPFEACLFVERLLESVIEVNSRGLPDKNDWMKALQECLCRSGEEVLEEDELERLWNANQADPTLQEIHFNRVLLIEVDRIAKDTFYSDPFYTALKEFISDIRSLEDSQNDRGSFQKFGMAYRIAIPGDFLSQVAYEIRSIRRFLKEKEQQLLDKSSQPMMKIDPEKSSVKADDWYFSWMSALSLFFQSFFKRDLRGRTSFGAVPSRSSCSFPHPADQRH